MNKTSCLPRKLSNSKKGCHSDPLIRYGYGFPCGVEIVQERLKPLVLHKEDRFLDLGCGGGLYVFEASKQVQEAWGLDASLSLIPQVKVFNIESSNMYFHKVKFQDVEFSDGYFNEIYARNSLCYLSDKERLFFLKRIAHAFAPRALFLLEDVVLFPGWEKAVLDFMANKPGIVLPLCLVETGHNDIYPFDANRIEGNFSQAGFKLLDIWQTGLAYGVDLFQKI